MHWYFDFDPRCLGIPKRIGASITNANRDPNTDTNRNTKTIDDADAFAIRVNFEQSGRIGHAMPLAQRNLNTVPDTNRLAVRRDTVRLAEHQPEGLGVALT